MTSGKGFVVSILDYGAGNVRSLRNAIKHLGYETQDILSVEDLQRAEVVVFPGQGCFRQAMESLAAMGLVDPLREYIEANRPFFGICLGMQLLFESSEESPGVSGLGIIPSAITKFTPTGGVKVPQIGWNGLEAVKSSSVLEAILPDDKAYFVHSYCALPTESNREWALTLTDYGPHRYISCVQRGNVFAAQFHPEKSGAVGLQMIDNFLRSRGQLQCGSSPQGEVHQWIDAAHNISGRTRRVIACLDVRSNDQGDLVVTKGDQYDVRESSLESSGRGDVRNLGKPVALSQRYFSEGADEVVFLNITSYRQGVLEDAPMLQVLQHASEEVFVPLTVGGGIREYSDSETGRTWTALDVAAQYFRAGADKVSISSDAVLAAEAYLSSRVLTGTSSIEQITSHYGTQAVVVSIDPKRVYVCSPDDVVQTDTAGDALSKKTVLPLRAGEKGPNGEAYCWWQVTVKGGRETRDMDAIQLAKISQMFGAGEIMLNCIDMDGQGKGFDIALIDAVQSAVDIPVIASSGAGSATHFVDVFQQTQVNAALAAGIFHRHEVSIAEVKEAMLQNGIPVRIR